MATPQSYTDVLSALGVDVTLLPSDWFDQAMAIASPDNLKQRAADFGAAVQELGAMQIDPQAHPDMYAQQQALLALANKIAPVVQWATAVFSDVATWFSNASSTVADWAGSVSSAYSSAVDWTSNELSALFGPDVSNVTQAKPVQGLRGLGMLQLIPVAIIAGCIAMMAYWVSQYATFKQKAAIYQSTLAAGGTVQQATAAANSVAPSSAAKDLSSSVSGVLWPLVGLGALFALVKFAPEIKAAFSGRGRAHG